MLKNNNKFSFRAVILLLPLFISSSAFADKMFTNVTFPDSWGAFEFIHVRSEQTKLNVTAEMLYRIITNEVKSSFVPGTNGKMENVDYWTLIEQLYPGPPETAVPMDAYHLAVQKALDQKQALKEACLKPGVENPFFEIVFRDELISLYAMGKGPASVTNTSMEQLKSKDAQDKAYLTNLSDLGKPKH